MPRNQHRALGTGLERSTLNSKKITSYSNTGVYNLTQSRELMGIEDQPVPLKPNSPNTKRKKNFPRDMMRRGGIRILVNFDPRGHRSILQLARTSLTITLLWAQSQMKNLILGHVSFPNPFAKGEKVLCHRDMVLRG